MSVLSLVNEMTLYSTIAEGLQQVALSSSEAWCKMAGYEYPADVPPVRPLPNGLGAQGWCADSMRRGAGCS